MSYMISRGSRCAHVSSLMRVTSTATTVQGDPHIERRSTHHTHLSSTVVVLCAFYNDEIGLVFFSPGNYSVCRSTVVGYTGGQHGRHLELLSYPPKELPHTPLTHY